MNEYRNSTQRPARRKRPHPARTARRAVGAAGVGGMLLMTGYMALNAATTTAAAVPTATAAPATATASGSTTDKLTGATTASTTAVATASTTAATPAPPATVAQTTTKSSG
ncbi:MAG: hypothetical protein IPP16_13790 [Acidimicrobiaceae bacterium]|jgi:hypothetical protein|nr:hypothetical protein [Acidimicrobiaceae bacterium]